MRSMRAKKFNGCIDLLFILCLALSPPHNIVRVQPASHAMTKYKDGHKSYPLPVPRMILYICFFLFFISNFIPFSGPTYFVC